MNFCNKCKKVVPDDEILDFASFVKPGLMGTSCKTTKIHRYQTYTNKVTSPYKSDMIGSCLVKETIYCGSIIEPSAEEYFIYITCGIREDYKPGND